MNGRKFWIFSIVISLALHAGMFLFYGLPLGNLLSGLDPRTGKPPASPSDRDRQVLLDLKEDSPTPEKDETGKFIARQNRIGLGRQTVEKGINRPGQQDQGSLSAQPPAPPEKQAVKPPDRTELGERSAKHKTSLSLESPVAVWTGEGNALNLGEAAARFQVGAEAYIYADFLNQYFKSVLKALMPYLEANNLANYLMRDDAVTVLSWVDREGRIGYERMLNASRLQPFLNHAAEGAASYAGVVPAPPPSLFSPSAERVYIPLEISLRRSPGIISLSVPKIMPTSRTEAP